MFRRSIARYWPFIGLEKVMGFLRLPVPAADPIIRNLRGYPVRLKFKPNTYQGMFLYYRGIYEERVIKTLLKLLSPDMTFLDVGANIGLYTVIAASHLCHGNVVSIEPQPDLCAILRENLALNALDNVVLHECALGETSGEAELFHVSRTNDGQATLNPGRSRTFGSITVPIKTPSDVLDGPVDAIKIDVEGAELAVLRALESTFRRKRPKLVFLECIEAHLSCFGDSTDELLALLHDHGFRVYCLYRARWRRIRSYSDHARYGFSPDLMADRP